MSICQWLLTDGADGPMSTPGSHFQLSPVKAWTLRFGGLEPHPVAAQAGKIQTVQMTKQYFLEGEVLVEQAGSLPDHARNQSDTVQFYEVH